MDEPYSAARFEALLDSCFVHKLTHKVDPGSVQGGTLLSHLLELAGDREGPRTGA
jgi:hypothetical protein